MAHMVSEITILSRTKVGLKMGSNSCGALFKKKYFYCQRFDRFENRNSTLWESLDASPMPCQALKFLLPRIFTVC